jgi:outer membrane protein TolC
MTSTRRLVRRVAPAAVVLLGGCTTLGPNFSAPQMPSLQGWSGGAWRTLAEEAPRHAQPRDDDWWRQFGDPVLDQLVAEAQRLNPGVRTAGLRIMEARAQLGIAGSGLYPQLQQVNGEALRVRNRGSDGRNTAFWSGSLAFDLAWELDFWGKFKRGIESADAAYFASIAQYDDVQVLVAAQAASLYASIRTTELRLRIANENAAIQQRSLEITERLFRSGNDSELDVQQARSQYLGTLATIPEIESSLRQTRNALCALLARPPDALPELQGGSAKIPEARLEVIVDIPGRDAAPPARRARRRDAAGRAVGADRHQRSGVVSVDRARGLGGPVGDQHRLARLDAELAFGPALVWNVFDHGRLSNQVLVQDARFQQLYEQYQDVVLRAARELDDAASGFAYTRAQVGILRDTVKAATALARHRDGPVSRRPGRLPARARFAAGPVRCAGKPGRQPGWRGSVPDRGLQGDGRRLAGRPLATGARRRHASDDGRARDWKSLLQAPLPPPSEEFLPPPKSDTP